MKKQTTAVPKAPKKKTKAVLAKEQWVRDAISLVDRLPQLSEKFKGMPKLNIAKGEPYIDDAGALQNFKVNPEFLQWAIQRSAEMQMDLMSGIFDF